MFSGAGIVSYQRRCLQRAIPAGNTGFGKKLKRRANAHGPIELTEPHRLKPVLLDAGAVGIRSIDFSLWIFICAWRVRAQHEQQLDPALAVEPVRLSAR